MNKNRVIVGSLAVSLAAPYLWVVHTNPGGPAPDAPKKVAFIALQNLAVSTSVPTTTMLVLDTMLGREISVAPTVDQHPRPAFIAPKLDGPKIRS